MDEVFSKVKPGEKYNYWTTIKKVSSKKYGGRVRQFWACKCKCGKIKEISKETLTSGNTKSCGCLHKEVLKSKKRPAFSYLFKECPMCNKLLSREKFGNERKTRRN